LRTQSAATNACAGSATPTAQQEEANLSRFGHGCVAVVDGLTEIFNRFEIPIGLIGKLQALANEETVGQPIAQAQGRGIAVT
jgi:hypothetical protein